MEATSLQKIAKAIAMLHLPLVVVQEGGYALESMGQNIVTFFTGLLTS
jgi:acetoin utilization deacetylase AcuC-like enzyme